MLLNTSIGILPSMSLNQDGSLYSIVSRLDGSYLVGFIIFYVVLDYIYKCYFHPLRNVPGPWLARFSQTWRNYRYFRGTWHDDILQIHQKYGDVARIAPDEVSFVDKEGLRNLYNNTQVKSNWYKTWSLVDMKDGMFGTLDSTAHRYLRARTAGIYTMTALLPMEPLIQNVADESWIKLGKLSDASKAIPINEWVTYYAYDVISQVGLGGKLGFLEHGRDMDELIASIHDGLGLMANMGNIPLRMYWFHNPISQWLTKRFGGKRLNAFFEFAKFLEMRVDERMKKDLGNDRKDMLQEIVNSKDMEKKDIMGEAASLIGAGADTTAGAILAIMGDLLLHPAYREKLQNEIDEAYQTLPLAGKEINFKDLENLPFFSAVIKESLRLGPSVRYQLPRVVPKGGLKLGEFFIPEGIICGISPAAMNRSKEIFGDDADEWNPERWIATDELEEKRIKTMNSFVTTFGLGSRSCLGKNLAMIEIYQYIAQFFHHFNAELVNPEKPWVVTSRWFTFQSDFWIKIHQREPKVD